MIYRVRHVTTYTYPENVSICHNELHLRPRESQRQRCAAYELRVYPLPAVLHQEVDFFGNHVTFFAVQAPHRLLTVVANSTVEVTPVEVPPAAGTPAWEAVCDALRHDRSAASLEAYQYVFDSPYVASTTLLRQYAIPSFPPGQPLLVAVLDLSWRIHTEFTYDSTATSVDTSLSEVLHTRHGVCQDFAHVQIGCLRALGLAARYVSGYLVTQPPPGHPHLVGADASHAWVSVYCPGFGWIDVDPTNNVLPSESHITVACGRDYGDVSPIQGVFLGGGQHSVKIAVDVMPVDI
jgi:transglutaminase-like putative cysteine protease